MDNSKHEQNLRNAEQARAGLTEDIREINRAGQRLMKHGEKTLKSSAMVLGASALGGMAVGVALGRASVSRRGDSLIGELLGRATTAFATALATQVLGRLLTKRV
jgi:hypothetical protein